MARSLHSISTPLPLSYSSSKACSRHPLTLPPLPAPAPASPIALRAASAPPRSSPPALPSRRRGYVACMAQPEIMTCGAVTDADFKELVLDSSLPVLVDFWAPWCGPCRMIAPLIDDIAKEYAGRLVCLKLNTDESPNVATELGIRSIPTVMFFQGGKKVDTVIGAVPKTTLTNIIDKYISE